MEKNLMNVSKYVKHAAKDCPCLFYVSKRDLNKTLSSFLAWDTLKQL